MIKTELKIHQLVGFSFVDFNIDLAEDVPLPIYKSINDVQQISDHLGSFTKSIKLPGTANNNKIFSEIFNLNRSVVNSSDENFNTDFNPALKADATVFKNGIVQIKGYLQLIDITVTNENEIEYEVTILGRFVNLFQDISGLKLADLNLSAYNHAFNVTNIQASWFAPVGIGYLYGLIDYGFSSNGVDYNIGAMLPQVYAKQLVDSIFSEAGYRYSSAFLTSERFKRHVIPFTGKALRISATEVSNRTFKIQRSSDEAYNNVGVRYIDYNDTVEDSIPSGVVLPAFHIQSSGNYEIECFTEVDFHNNGVTQANVAAVEVRKNGGQIAIKHLQQTGTITGGATLNLYHTIVIPSAYYAAGDVIDVRLLLSVFTGDIDARPKDGSYLTCTPGAEVTEGDTIVLSDTLANDIEQTDFLASIFKEFNLYVDIDPLDDKKLIIEPRDDFYLNTVTDLTPYVDVASGVKILPLGATQFKQYNYAYKEDKDILNEAHQNKYLDTYGNRKFEIVNDFVKEEYKTGVIFSATPLIDSPTQNDRVVSSIIFKDANGNRVDSSANIRILYYGGLIDCETWYIHDATTITGSAVYPYVGHLDSISNPQYDLSFGVPTELQYYAAKYTTNNIFRLYHEKGVREITDPDSKIVEFKMHLNEVLQSQMSFRELYFIDQQYYRLYQLEYDANSTDLSTVRFLKLKTANPEPGLQIDVNGGTGEEGGEGYPIYHGGPNRNGNAYDKNSDALIMGSDNSVGSDGAMVNSSGNSVQGIGTTILGGTGNTVGLPGTTLIGCEEHSPVQENEVAIRNIVQPQYYSQLLTVGDVSGLASIPLQVLPKYSQYYTEVVDAYMTVYDFGDEPVAFGVSAFTIQQSGPIITFTSDISEATTATRQRGLLADNVNQLEQAVTLTTDVDLGTGGTGKILIEIHYRTYPKLL